jgi:hypothetical protein
MLIQNKLRCCHRLTFAAWSNISESTKVLDTINSSTWMTSLRRQDKLQFMLANHFVIKLTLSDIYKIGLQNCNIFTAEGYTIIS